MPSWLVDGLTGAAIAVVAVVVGQLATRGGVTDWTMPAIVAAVSFVAYPVLIRRQRKR